MVQNISSGLSLSLLTQLDSAHLKGFTTFLTRINHNPKIPRHLYRASHALETLGEELRGNIVPDYKDNYVAAAYIVKYHLQHCVLAYWSFKTFFTRTGIPNSLYVCDIGAGTGAGRVGLALALAELQECPAVYFDSVEPARAMLDAGSDFWQALPASLTSLVPNDQYRESGSMLGVAPSIPEGTCRMVTAFHLTLPYNSGINRYMVDDFGSRSSIRQALNLVSPDVGVFTCHKRKDEALRQGVSSSTRWMNGFTVDIDIPTDRNGLDNTSHFYTDFVVPLGFEVSEGTSVSRWSRYRFSPPSGVLLLRTSASIAETSRGARVRRIGESRSQGLPQTRTIHIWEEATERNRATQESTAEMPPRPEIRRVGIRRSEPRRIVEKPGQPREVERPTTDSITPVTQPMAQPTTFSVGDRVNAGIMGRGVIKEIRKNKAVVLINDRIPCEVSLSELKSL